ncbi:MAG TPA: DinB family protein [Pyrinomonadaceae bacterium]|nr:DinB family protein [Pyrinomonadaceae bacterium]
MSEVARFLADLDSISNEATAKFSGLNADQINFKPSADSWSVGQCFEHLILTNDQITGAVERVADGSHVNSFWENWSPFTSFFGNFLIKSMKRDDKKFKVPSKSIVPPSNVDPQIVAKFIENNAMLIDLFGKIDSVDPEKIVITSPFMGLVTYKLAHGMTIIVEHERRHLRQAERVTIIDGFPS